MVSFHFSLSFLLSLCKVFCPCSHFHVCPWTGAAANAGCFTFPRMIKALSLPIHSPSFLVTLFACLLPPLPLFTTLSPLPPSLLVKSTSCTSTSTEIAGAQSLTVGLAQRRSEAHQRGCRLLTLCQLPAFHFSL